VHPVLTIALVVAGVVELTTVACGLLHGSSVTEFADAHRLPVLLRTHHGIWGLVLMLVSPALLGRPPLFVWSLGIGLGLFGSDVVHHLVVAPLIYGETRWHWP
jgi:hypothetical protein